ncbi:hypothetical protein [Pseudomonas cannabina]|uniref:hypothetical protein n=1 Tax=Pseudomonas cannabina TaxID=86840 RepID=UPI00111355CF|nr:hypothetical protein [Pseudomonas cannabina]
MVVDAHGYDSSIHGGPRMLMGQQPVSPNKLDLKLRQQDVKFDSYESVHLFMCNSATDGPESFAAEFSKLTGLPVKAYRGKVIGNGPAKIRRYENRQYETVFRLGIHKKNRFEIGGNLYKSLSYDPVWFTPF